MEACREARFRRRGQIRKSPSAAALLGVLCVSASAAPYRTSGVTVTAENSWCLSELRQKCGADGEKMATLYELILDTVRSDIEDGFAEVGKYGERVVSLRVLPYEYKWYDVWPRKSVFEIDDEEYTDYDNGNYLQAAVDIELRPLVRDVLHVDNNIDLTGNTYGIRICYGSCGPHYPYLEESWNAIIAATNSMIAEAKITAENVDTLSDYDKALALHDVFLRRVYYQMSGEHQVMYGGLVNGCCVCAGYAESYQWLLTQVGIPALWVPGDTSRGGHAWNLAKLDGVWYEFDPTWDDVSVGSEPCRHQYFGLSSEAMTQLDHRKWTWWNPLGYPDCPVSLPEIDKPSGSTIDPSTGTPVDNRVYTALPTEQEGWSLAYIGSARRGGKIVFSVIIDEDYAPGEDFAVTVRSVSLIRSATRSRTSRPTSM